MYELPGDHLLRKFVGNELVSIAIASNQIGFHFNNEPFITAGGPVVVIREDKSESAEIHPPIEAQPNSDYRELFRLLDSQVTSYTTNKARDNLTLTFETGLSLKFVGSNPNYECFDICFENERYTV